MIISEKKIKSQMILNIIYKVLGMGVSLIYVPILFNYLGDEKYGVWITINSIVAWITYFDIGIGNGLRNRLAENIGHNDVEAEKKTVSTAYISISLITGAIFCLAIIAMFFMDVPSLLNLSLGDENIKIVIMINIFFICINFVLSLCNTVLYALQLSSVVSLVSIIPQILNVILIYILSRTVKSDLVVLSMVYGLTVFMTNIIASITVFGKYKHLRPSLKLFDRKEMGYISGFGIKMFISQIAALVLNTTDNILISRLYGAASVTPYNMVYKIFSLVNMVHVALITPMWSSYTLANAQKNNKWLKKGLRKMQLLFIPFLLGTGLLMIIFKDLAYFWLGKDLDYPVILIVLTGAYFIVLMWTNIYSSFLCGIGKINKMMWISIFQAVFNIPLSIFFSVQLNMGVSGIILGSLIVMLMAAIILPIQAKTLIKEL